MVLAAREKKLFNSIAPYYGLFFNLQVRYYHRILASVRNKFDIAKFESIIDLGCGTGALCYVLNQQGLRVTGADAAAKMLAIAGKKLAQTGVELREVNVLETIPFPDKSFDIVISSYAVHGMKQGERLKMYAEMSRLAKKYVIIHDYNDRRSLIINFIERLEGGDYFNFINQARQEMEDVFGNLMVFDVSPRAAWYVAAQ